MGDGHDGSDVNAGGVAGSGDSRSGDAGRAERVVVIEDEGEELALESFERALSEAAASAPAVELVAVDEVDAVLDEASGECLVVPAAHADRSLEVFLRELSALAPATSVVVHGHSDARIGPAAVNAGIDRFVRRDESDFIERLVTAVTDALYPKSGEISPDRNGDSDPGDDEAAEATGARRDLALHSSLIENSSDVLAILNRDGSFEYVSPAIERVLGWVPRDLEGEDAIEYIHPDDHDVVLDDFYGDPATWVGEQREVTFRFRNVDGEYRIVESTARSLLDDPIVDGVVLNSRDVTGREERKRELELYETIVENVPVGLFVVDEGAEFEMVNAEATRLVESLTDYEEGDDLLEVSVLDMIREGYFEPDMATKYVDGVRDMLSSTTEADRLVEDVPFYPHAGGDTHFFNVHWALRPLDDGEFQGTIVIFQEITERKQFEEQLREKNERLEQFASFVSHDIRNPLNVAQGFAMQAREDGDPKAVAEIQSALDRIEQLIDELLTMAAEGQDVDEIVEVELDAVAERGWATVDTKNATLDVADADAVVRADEGLFRQTFENLFRNAIEHGRADVAVTVGVLEDANGFYVADDGPGIPPAERENVLEMGYTTSADGTGFGLGIVTQAADAHDWTVSVAKSDVGGARFEFSGVEESDGE